MQRNLECVATQIILVFPVISQNPWVEDLNLLLLFKVILECPSSIFLFMLGKMASRGKTKVELAVG
jgi:hypothetical protein